MDGEPSRYAVPDKDYIYTSVEVSEPIYVSGSNTDRQTELLQDPYKVSGNVCETYCVTTQRINPNMPEFTFIRIVGGYADVHLVYGIPSPVEISIIVKDGESNILQAITGLSQSRGFIDYDITFDDYNFDGYLDMRLKRWQDSAGGLLAREYIWLWDNQVGQFVMNEQLMLIEHTGLMVNHETQQIAIWRREGNFGYESFYEYYDGKYIKVIFLDEEVLSP